MPVHRNTRIRIVIPALAVLFVVLPYPYITVARGQGVASQAMLKTEFEQSFRHMLRDPGNVELTLRYSNLAEQLGDYEAAIPPLERLLMFNPDLPDIKLKLGVLYHRLGSREVAEAYFESVMDSKNASPHVLAEAKHYLKQM